MIRDYFHAAPWAGERQPMPPIRMVDVELRMDRVFTLPEIAETLGVSLRQVRAHVHDGSLIAFNVGRGAERRDLRVLDQDLEAFARRRRVPTAANIHRASGPAAIVRKGGN